MEIWKPIKDYETRYQISNMGNIKSFYRGKETLLKPQLNNTSPYLMIGLFKNNKLKRYLIHRLVAQHFIPNPDNLPEVNHKDENKYNNCADNLEWCTHKYNTNYGTRGDKISEKLMKNKNAQKRAK